MHQQPSTAQTCSRRTRPLQDSNAKEDAVQGERAKFVPPQLNHSGNRKPHAATEGPAKHASSSSAMSTKHSSLDNRPHKQASSTGTAKSTKSHATPPISGSKKQSN
ncbi:uncharacterized protein [Lolium perenne]|uniref:uncharacterized protein n=1 Tax=Lolium perenne TaxID=4522 RepID=UPI003A996717